MHIIFIHILKSFDSDFLNLEILKFILEKLLKIQFVYMELYLLLQ